MPPHLFTPFSLRAATFKNRIVVSPMCQYSAVNGATQDWHQQHHSRLALGGAGAAFVEATAVTAEGRITPGCTGLYSDVHIPGLRRIVDLYHAQGALAGIQIGHAGRKASSARPWDGGLPLPAQGPEPAWRTVAPSSLAGRPGWPAPHALAEPEIVELLEAFRRATERAMAAGFDMIEIHGAHGYLVHSFFSPLANLRQDTFGGSLENRMRFPLLVAQAVRSAMPEGKPLFYRASAVDEVEGGVTIEDTIALARALREAGVDVIDCSSGGILGAATLAVTRPSPGYQVPLAAAVRQGASIATMAVGLITEPTQAEAILAEGKADLIALGRELLADSNWAYRAAVELAHDAPYSVMPPAFGFYLERRRAIIGR